MKNRIRLFKIVDPIVQTVLFLLFVCAVTFSVYILVTFFILFGWQLFSALLHLSFKKMTKLKQQRKIHLIVSAIYVGIYFILSLLPPVYIRENFAEGVTKVPVYDLVMVAAGTCICFWYVFICLREIKRIINKNYHIDV